MTSRSAFRPAGGFTLIEVLVAMTIMAIIAIMAWQGVDGIVRSRNISQGRLEQLLRVNTVLAQWEQDLGAVQESSTGVQALRFDGASLTLTRRTPKGLQLVVWSLRNGIWMRWTAPPVTTTQALKDNQSASQQLLGNEAGQLKALTGISEWQLYYYIDNGWSNAQSSTASYETSASAPPNTATSDKLPTGVRLVLTFNGTNGLNGKVTREIWMGPQQ